MFDNPGYFTIEISDMGADPLAGKQINVTLTVPGDERDRAEQLYAAAVNSLSKRCGVSLTFHRCEQHNDGTGVATLAEFLSGAIVGKVTP